MIITIYGASDDLVEVTGCEGADEFYTQAARNGDVCWHGRLIAPANEDVTEQLSVRAIFDGCWHLAAGQVDESLPFPPWPVTVRAPVPPDESPHSAVLIIEAPEGTQIDSIWPDQS